MSTLADGMSRLGRRQYDAADSVDRHQAPGIADWFDSDIAALENPLFLQARFQLLGELIHQSLCLWVTDGGGLALVAGCQFAVAGVELDFDTRPAFLAFSGIR